MSDPSRNSEIAYQLLRQIAKQTSSQRDLAQRLGISVGKINYCLRAVVNRGWVKVDNFRRADNKLAYAYLLTPSGAKAKVRLARAFLEQKEHEFERLQRELQNLRRELVEGTSRDE